VFARCVRSRLAGRTVCTYAHGALLREARQHQQTDEFKELIACVAGLRARLPNLAATVCEKPATWENRNANFSGCGPAQQST
jgi:hypothetical protein